VCAQLNTRVSRLGLEFRHVSLGHDIQSKQRYTCRAPDFVTSSFFLSVCLLTGLTCHAHADMSSDRR
jgi:hypothetical protein